MKKINIVSIVLIAIIVCIGGYFIISSRIDAKYTLDYSLDNYYKMPPKKLGVNEYTVSSVTREDMVKTYFNRYITMMIENAENAYLYVDEDEKNSKFPSLQIFKKHVEYLTDNYERLPKLKTYDIGKEDEYLIYKMSDDKGNIYIFKIEAVMKYSVSFQ